MDLNQNLWNNKITTFLSILFIHIPTNWMKKILQSTESISMRNKKLIMNREFLRLSSRIENIKSQSHRGFSSRDSFYQ